MRRSEYEGRVAWVYNTNINYDTEWLLQRSDAEGTEARVRLASEAGRYANTELPPDTLRDVLRNVSGISMAAGEGGGGPGGDNLTLRGFGARNDIFVDGIRDTASYTRDTFNIEQVEVVKGPASAQTGRGSTLRKPSLKWRRPASA